MDNNASKAMTKLLKLIKIVKDIWLILGVTLFLLIVIEACILTASFVKKHFIAPPAKDSRIHADSYDDSSWLGAYYSELDRSSQARWEPYIYWRRSPYHGNYINIDSDGNRLTVNSASTRAPLKIFMFGASTLWGTGDRDEFTIPSILAKDLEKSGVDCKVVNFSEAGFVSTQQIIQLMLQLQKNNIPDIVIFYGGGSDTLSAYQQGVAGLPVNEFNRVREFNLSKPERFWPMTFWEMVNKHSADSLGIYDGSKNVSRDPLLAQQVVQIYTNNLKLMKALSVAYGFKSLSYLEPAIFQKKHLSSYETGVRDQEAHARDKKQSLEDFFDTTHDLFEKSIPNLQKDYSLYDVSMIFSDVSEPIFLDWAHVGEKGNGILAQRMAEDVEKVVRTHGVAGNDTAPSASQISH